MLSLVALSGCTETQWTSIYNETGQTIVLKVQVSGEAEPIQVSLQNGRKQSFREKLRQIVAVEYSYPGKACRLLNGELRRIARPIKWGIWFGERAQDIVLRGC